LKNFNSSRIAIVGVEGKFQGADNEEFDFYIDDSVFDLGMDSLMIVELNTCQSEEISDSINI